MIRERSRAEASEADLNVEITDQLLIQRVLGGETDAYSLLVRRWERLLWERRAEKAVEEAHRLVEEYRRGERRPRGR